LIECSTFVSTEQLVEYIPRNQHYNQLQSKLKTWVI